MWARLNGTYHNSTELTRTYGVVKFWEWVMGKNLIEIKWNLLVRQIQWKNFLQNKLQVTT